MGPNGRTGGSRDVTIRATRRRGGLERSVGFNAVAMGSFTCGRDSHEDTGSPRDHTLTDSKDKYGRKPLIHMGRYEWASGGCKSTTRLKPLKLASKEDAIVGTTISGHYT